MSKYVSPERLLAKNISFYLASGGQMDRVARRFGLTEGRATQIVQAWGDRYPALREAARNLGAQAEQAAVAMSNKLEPACKQLKAALGAPPC